MLPEFKKRIDTLRDILVGAVPSPAGQIEQITYALIYKFMSDIDDRAASLPGGKRTYFTGEYEKYGWHELMAATLGAHDRLALYREALGSIAKNPGLPTLFQEIYQNAYLTFNDPRVLTLFLKEIDNFKHSNSDDIGDAYEYLLQITGAQGDVGQFRTPRHIIKFIVEAVNPTKTDSVLDPAVGTAGFLIAAYNHVKHHHDGVDEITGLASDKEERLTADELDKLHKNYYGFDIDPTMVRTAKVNMYLHGFKTPDIKNHDSLSEETYWNERYDVILANPPFMSPKGGIKPHDKFGIVANRAEVLFVDYIASHLKPTGRAGIVVPEGIIFQSGKAYKELRKNLVDNYLYAVVSLPAGVFNPYAGVKTSVLLLDKELAKQRDEVLFVKVENDGYSLNAQRRPIAGNQLPEALQSIERFKNGEELQSEFAHAASRNEIAGSGDYNLSGGRYKILNHNINKDYEYFSIDELVDTISATVRLKASEVLETGAVPVIDQSQKYVAGYTDNLDAKITSVPVVAFGDHTKAVKYVDFSFAQGADGIKILRPKNGLQLTPKYLFYAMSYMEMPDKGYSRHWTEVKTIKIPLPPIETQREIVAELDGYQKIIDAAQTIVQAYKPTIEINPDSDMVRLGDKSLFDIQSGGTPSSKEPAYWDGNVNWATLVDLPAADFITELADTKRKITELGLSKSSAKLLPIGTILVSTRATIGRVAIARTETATNQGFKNIIVKDANRALPEYIAYQTTTLKATMQNLASGGTFSELSKTSFETLKIPLPPIEIQREIVTVLENEQKLIEANKKLIEIYQQKIKSKIAEVWGE